MTVNEAVKHFFNSDVFKERAKAKDSEGGVLRNNKSRFNKGRLGNESAIAMLVRYGYEVNEKITVKAPKKKKP